MRPDPIRAVAARRTPCSRIVACVLALACLVLGAAASASASQVLEVREGDTTVVRISVRDQTRLRVASGRIVDVIGDVFDAQRNPGGRIAVLKDDADGEVYVRPAPQSPQMPAVGAPAAAPAAPIKLDVKTTRGTVGLLLQPADVVGQTLTLRITGQPATSAALAATEGGGEARGEPRGEPRGKGASHVRAVKALTLAMAAPGLAPEVPVQLVPGGQEMGLWVEARFVLRARYEAPGLVGEAFTLTNVSGSRMVIDERELFKPGVLSVSVKHLALEPGQMTPVWIVRLPDSPEGQR
ncbi:MAG: type-F conjugative transfer system secretin TraK [Rubrivivax sp.]|nr:type-F conjugative transfer system secretin TraK [Rubrivivax sp.]